MPSQVLPDWSSTIKYEIMKGFKWKFCRIQQLHQIIQCLFQDWKGPYIWPIYISTGNCSAKLVSRKKKRIQINYSYIKDSHVLSLFTIWYEQKWKGELFVSTFLTARAGEVLEASPFSLSKTDRSLSRSLWALSFAEIRHD